MILSGFSGANKALHPRNLPDTVGVDSLNQKPGRGDLRPWRVPLEVATVPTGTQRKTIALNGRDATSDALYWHSWTSVVHVIRGFDASDTTKRLYYTGDGAPKFTDNTSLSGVLENPQTYRPLGVPAPLSALTVALDTAGPTGGVEETWYYVHTFVTDLGWESAPSPPSAAFTGLAGTTTTLGSLEAAPAGNYYINRRRIYRTKTGTSGDTEFFFLREVAIGITSTADDNRTLGDVLPTQGDGSLGQWVPPPDDGKFLTAMWNGMAAMISGKTVRICVQNALYAWPLRYALTFTETPVALAVFEQNLLVLTTGRPYLVAGDSPGNLNVLPLSIDQSCIAPQSVVSFGSGVVWASPDGLVLLDGSGPRLLTAGILTRDDWQAMAPGTIVAERYEGVYFASYNNGALKGFMIDVAGPKGIFPLASGYNAMVRDTLTDALYVLDGRSIKKWDAGASYMACMHQTKTYRGGAFSMAQVTADAYPVTLTLINAATASAFYTREVEDGEAFALPDGMPEDWQVRIETTGPAQFIQLVHNAQELV